MRLYDLKTNNLKDNRNIDRQSPVFSWKAESMEAGRRYSNIYQESYRIRVWREAAGAELCREAERAGNVVWDSGVVMSGRMANVKYRGEELSSDCRYVWTVECVFRYEQEDVRNKCTAVGEAWFETGYFRQEDWKGCFIGETRDHEYHLYRKSFRCDEKIRRAKLYICGLGHFECYLNGGRVSDHVLEPGWTDYRKTCFYTAYDVTDMVTQGKNAILVKLGDGMYNVPGGRFVYHERSYGKAKLLVQLALDYADGSKELVVTDHSWKMAPSPVKFCCIYGGEDYDGRLWKDKYLQGDYEEEAVWEPAPCVEPPQGRLTAMPMEPMKVKKKYAPFSVAQTAPGVWLYDLGTNFSGWVRIRIKTDGKSAGKTIKLKPGELLHQDGRINQRLTADNCYWSYTLDEREEQEFAPDFTYTGFRYVELTGAVPEGMEAQTDAEGGGLPLVISLTGEFLYPDVEKAGDFSCSNELFNDIHSIVLQAILSNTKSYFTDCPQREKLAWLEETHLIGPSIMYNLDVHSLYDKIEGDMADAQWDNGLVTDICPEYVTGFGKWHQGFVDSPEWGSACILNPWYVYKRYGDISLLERYYGVMRRYLDYLDSRTHHQVLHHGLGDWLDIGPCNPHSQNTPVPVVATCVYYYDLSVMKQVAELLGKGEDAKEYQGRMERVFREYNLQFLDDQTGRYATGSQAAQAMSLIVGLVPEDMEERVVKQLRDDVIKRDFAITAGDIGHPFLIAAMMKYGMSDLLNQMTNITETPGYGYQVVRGATTLTESWDGPDRVRPHGSQNHLMLGSIEEWFYGSLGGVELMRDGLPFDEVRIAPRPEEGVDWVSAWVMHPYGRIAVDWKRKEGRVEVKVTIPPNVTAYLESPDGQIRRKVGSGRHTYRFSC